MASLLPLWHRRRPLMVARIRIAYRNSSALPVGVVQAGFQTLVYWMKNR
jgi:hypothetical protein